MAKTDVVTYLQTYMKKFPIDEMRKQLKGEGVTDAEFDEALKVAMRTPLAKKVAPKKHLAGAIFLIGGVLIILILGLISLNRNTPEEDPTAKKRASLGDSAFVGDYGYVIKLPEGYQATAEKKGPGGKIEVVYFSKKGTSPTNFINEGLYGQLGIIRLEVRPHPLAGEFRGMDTLTALVEAWAIRREEKFTKKPIAVSALHGTEFIFEVPSARLETYFLGEKHLYLFTAGQADELYKEIIYSLRDTHTGI